MSIRNGSNRSPIDMFGFDMLVYGLRGQNVELSNEELELFGVDWEGLRDDRIRSHHRCNNPTNEGDTSWLGRAGPPEELNEVRVEPPVPSGVFEADEVSELNSLVQPWLGTSDEGSVIQAWTTAIVFARRIFAEGF